jgi:di/tricarboxylate transporter
VHLLALVDPGQENVSDLRWRKFTENDRLVLQGERSALEEVARQGLVSDLRFPAPEEIQSLAAGCDHHLLVGIPPGSVLANNSLTETRLGSAFGLTVVAIRRNENLLFLPQPQEMIAANDLLILQGAERDLDIFKALQELQITEQSASLAAELESNQIGITEVLLSPRTTLVGKTVTELLFREHYGLNVLAIWRKGQVYRKGLQDMPLHYGDALLVYGQRQNLEAVARSPDFLVLDHAALKTPRLDKAPAATLIMLGVLLSATLGFVPIAIAALTGSALMVLFGCLSMEEAYGAIEWKVIFLIASMLPLGIAVQHTGVAQMGANVLISLLGHLGPRWIMAAIFLITVIGNQVIQPAALVVLMAPVALSIAKTMGISPHLLMMTVAMAAASCYASPLSHPANLLVMGPGGYRFIDYLKVGIPLTLMAMALCLWLLPIFWPA